MSWKCEGLPSSEHISKGETFLNGFFSPISNAYEENLQETRNKNIHKEQIMRIFL